MPSGRIPLVDGSLYRDMILAMAADVVITLVGYLLTAGVTLCWVFMSRQKRVPRTRRTMITVSLRILPVFLLLFIVCQQLEINVIAAFAVLAMVCWLILISPGLFGLGGIGVLYVVQQWILGWPDRDEFLLDPPRCETARTPLDGLIGKRGVTSSTLRPGGIIVVDEVEYPAQSDLGYVDRDLDVVVVGRKNGSLLVRSAVSAPHAHGRGQKGLHDEK